VRKNRVHENNLPNSSHEGVEQLIPSGSGILVIGTDLTTVRQNLVTGNSFVGIGVANTTLLARLGGFPIDVEPFPDHTRVIGNTALGNGGAQPIPFLPPGVDLIWDGTGTDNCWSRNRFGASLDLNLLGGTPTPVLPACRWLILGPPRAWRRAERGRSHRCRERSPSVRRKARPRWAAEVARPIEWYASKAPQHSAGLSPGAARGALTAARPPCERASG
jgi:hypothetical protein